MKVMEKSSDRDFAPVHIKPWENFQVDKNVRPSVSCLYDVLSINSIPNHLGLNEPVKSQ